MKSVTIDDLKSVDLNRYEAVIVASRHARHLNTQRIEALERLEEDPTVDIDSRKITMVALKDVLEGRVKFGRPDSM